MAGTTYDGLHDPLGVDPVEPATGTTPEKNAKPTDVALLARSIQAAYPRCAIHTAGTAATLAFGVPVLGLPLGAALADENVPGFYTRVSYGSGHGIEVSEDGLYRTSIIVFGTGVASYGGAASVDPAAGMPIASSVSVARVNAGDPIIVNGVQTVVGSATLQVLSIAVERIGA